MQNPILSVDGPPNAATLGDCVIDVTTGILYRKHGNQWSAGVIIGALSTTYDFVYKFSVDGGVIGTIPLRGAKPLPIGFVITGVIKEVKTALDSAAHTATGALTSGEVAGDILAATLVSNTTWTTTGVISHPSVIKTTALRVPSLVVAVQNLNAGEFTLHISGHIAP
jgi:hypothetical protein